MLAVYLMFSAIGCNSSSTSDFDFEQAAASIRASTTPKDARVVNVVATSHSDFHIESSWEVESNSTWKEYTEDVRGRLPSGYALKKAEAESFFFYKSLDRDSLTVEVQRISVGPPIRVRVTFRASAG